MFFDSTTKNCLTIKAHCYRKLQQWVFSNARFVTFSILAFLFESIEQKDQVPHIQKKNM